MTMKQLCLTALLALWCLCAPAAEKSPTIVYINGAKYYVHTVQPGETLYALSKAYDVSEKVILENNPSLAGGLKAAAVIKIPFVSEVPAPKPDRKLRKTFDFHYVTKGETLYAISRKYEIPVQTIIEDNPGIDPTHLRLDERLLIRRKQIGSEDESGSKEQWEQYRQSLNSVADEGTSYHIVRPGETFYSLSRRFGTFEAIYWYDFQDDGTNPTNPEHNFGLIREDFSPKPAYVAAAVLTNRLGKRKWKQSLAEDNTLVEIHQFGEDKDPVIVGWAKHDLNFEIAPISIPSGKYTLVDWQGSEKTVEVKSGKYNFNAGPLPQYLIPQK